MRQDKIENFMMMAHTISLRSPDPNTKVGSVITDIRGRVIGTGYNGFPRDTEEGVFPTSRENGDLYNPNSKYPYVVHSEKNSLHNMVVVPHYIGGAILYCNAKVCCDCLKEVWAAGIHTVYQGNLQPGMVDDNHRRISEKLIREIAIKVIDIDCSQYSWYKYFSLF
jgi:deoxycytidylate deaminase